MSYAFDEVLSDLKKSPDPISDILRSAAYFLPLQLLYCDLVKNKDLKPLVDLSNEEKQSYWSLVVGKDEPKYVKIWKCQSLYVYNWLSNEQNDERSVATEVDHGDGAGKQISNHHRWQQIKTNPMLEQSEIDAIRDLIEEYISDTWPYISAEVAQDLIIEERRIAKVLLDEKDKEIAYLKEFIAKHARIERM